MEEKSKIDRIIEAKQIINSNLDTDMNDLYGPVSEALGIENNEEAQSLIFRITCGLDSNEALSEMF